MKRKLIAAAAVVCGSVLVGACEQHAKNGDVVIIDFAGFLNGEQFQGGTSTGYALRLGSGQFIPGFEEQLVGAKKGETREIKVRFPEDYQAQHLAGQETVFKVTIKDIVK